MIPINTKERYKFEQLRVGDIISLSGTVYTARDAAHKRLMDLINNSQPLPFDLKDSVIYYAGPTPAKNGLAVGSCGPTTSARMDSYSPILMDLGLCATIGKGKRNEEVKQSCVKNKSVYLCAIGGAGALACKCIKAAEVIAFQDLGCESIKKLDFNNFLLTVAIDVYGEDLFKSDKYTPFERKNIL